MADKQKTKEQTRQALAQGQPDAVGQVLSGVARELLNPLSVVNNAAAITLAGRTITQEFVEEQLKERDGKLPESLTSDPDQPPWSITFAKRKPVQYIFDEGGSFE